MHDTIPGVATVGAAGVSAEAAESGATAAGLDAVLLGEPSGEWGIASPDIIDIRSQNFSDLHVSQQNRQALAADDAFDIFLYFAA